MDMLCAVCGDCVAYRDICGNRAELSAILEIVQSAQVLENGKEHLDTSGAVQSAQVLADREEHSGILRNYAQRSGVRGNCAWCSGT